ncbi:MAG TPA: glycosyltransferase family 4 protein [Anaerolineae bacterium]|nr:glycosyltransferase family 4 protein [Anaerolineae bacterium]
MGASVVGRCAGAPGASRAGRNHALGTNPRLNILIITLRGPSNHWRAGGGEEVIAQVGKCWVEDGHHVRVLCTREGPQFPSGETVQGVEVVRSGSFHSALPSLAWRYKKEHRPWADVVLESILAYPLYVPLYSRRPTCALVHHVMGRSWFEVLPFPKALFGYLTERSIPYFYRHSRLVAVSEGTRHDLLGLGVPEGRVVVAPCGVDTQRYVPGHKSARPLICFVGTLDDRRKRVEDLIDVFPYITEQVPGARLVIAGGGGREAELRRRAAASKNVEFVGFVEEDEKIDLYQRSWVGVFPSSKEGFLLTALEASACGTPVVTYEHPGTTTVVDGKTGLVVPRGDRQRLASAVVSLLKDPQRRLEMGQRGRAHALQFSWPRMADIILRELCRDGEERRVGAGC